MGCVLRAAITTTRLVVQETLSGHGFRQCLLYRNFLSKKNTAFLKSTLASVHMYVPCSSAKVLSSVFIFTLHTCRLTVRKLKFKHSECLLALAYTKGWDCMELVLIVVVLTFACLCRKQLGKVQSRSARCLMSFKSQDCCLVISSLFIPQPHKL